MAFSYNLQAQFVTIPDVNFRNKLKILFPASFNASNQMDTTSSLIVNAQTLNIFTSGISNLDGIQYFDNIITLDCHGNLFTSIAYLPNTLKTINCNSCGSLTTLPTLPSGLIRMYSSNCSLTSLPALPSTLINLSCSHNQLSTLPTLPTLLDTLEFRFNLFTTMPTLPNSLRWLDFGFNQISTISNLPPTLVYFVCDNNQITSLPSLPGSLKVLGCVWNKLINLPNLPNSLGVLNCWKNSLTSLPALPDSLQTLQCHGNFLTVLPSLPTPVYGLTINCGNNLLTSLPSLPNGLTSLDCSDNLQLNCLPLLPSTLTNLYFANSPITCIPNKPNNNSIYNAWSICANGTACEPSPTCAGIVYYDINNNNVYDINLDFPIQGNTITNSNSWAASTFISGEYQQLKLDSGILNTFSASTLQNPYVASIFPTNYSITPITSGSQGLNYDFAVHLLPNKQDLKVDISNNTARPGFNQIVNVLANNVGTIDMTNTTIKLLKPSSFVYINSTPAISSQVGDTLIWNNINLNIFQQKTFSVTWNVPSTTNIGQNYQLNAWILPNVNDLTPMNNKDSVNRIVMGAYDPNEKTVSSNSFNSTTQPNELKYTINFQNTGTDTAFSILIRDELSDKLDLNTFQMLGASHNYLYIIKDKGLLEVYFPNHYQPTNLKKGNK